jgi:hypothetical protein
MSSHPNASDGQQPLTPSLTPSTAADWERYLTHKTFALVVTSDRHPS